MKDLTKHAYVYDEYLPKEFKRVSHTQCSHRNVKLSIDCHEDLDITSLQYQYFITTDTNQIAKVPGPFSKFMETGGTLTINSANNLPPQSFISLLSLLQTIEIVKSSQDKKRYKIILTLYRSPKQKLFQYISLLSEDFLIEKMGSYNIEKEIKLYLNDKYEHFKEILVKITRIIQSNEIKLGFKLSYFKLNVFLDSIIKNKKLNKHYLTEENRMDILYCTYINFIVGTPISSIQEEVIIELCNILRLDHYEIMSKFNRNYNYLLPINSNIEKMKNRYNDLITTQSNIPLLCILNNLIEFGNNVILSGEQGIGKTAIIETLAKQHKRKLFIYNCNIQSSSEDVLKLTKYTKNNKIYKNEHNKKIKINTIHEVIPLLEKIIKEGNWVFFDEANLAEKSFFDGILSFIENNKEYNTTFFLSLNPPKPSKTSAVKKDIDASLKQYFTTVHVEDKYTKEELKEIIQTKFHNIEGFLTNKNKFLFDKAIEFYLNLRTFDTLKSSFVNMRTLLRSFEYINRLIQTVNFETSVYESFYCFFITQINPNVLYRTLDNTYIKKGDFILSFDDMLKEFNIENAQSINYNSNNEFVLTDNIKSKLREVETVIKANKYPILLKGETSAGKTSIVQHLAKQQNQILFKINNHIDSDINDYFGGYSLNNGIVEFNESNFIKCIKRGNWVLLDELNLAPSDFLESLNRLLDNNRTLIHPETNKAIKAHENFLLLSTINPSSNDYLGRNKLSDAFKSRFITIYYEKLIDKDTIEILTKKYCLARSFSTYLTSIKNKINLEHLNLNEFGSSNTINFRELSRISKRKPSTWNELLLISHQILSSKFKTNKDKLTIFKILNKEAKLKLQINEDLQINVLNNLIIHNLELSKTTKIKEFLETKGFIVTDQILLLFYYILNSYYNKEAVLLTGPTSKGKTSICLLIAEFLNKHLLTINCHADTESSDFIGRTKPCKSSFVWQDGILTKALKDGDVLLIDEINMADTSAIERINSVFDTPSNLQIYESNKNENVEIHEKSFIIATMNPSGDFGKKELSLPLRNRFREIYFDWEINKEFINKLIKTKVNNKHISELIKDIILEDIKSNLKEICLRKTNKFINLANSITFKEYNDTPTQKELLVFLYCLINDKNTRDRNEVLKNKFKILNEDNYLINIDQTNNSIKSMNFNFTISNKDILNSYSFKSDTVSFNLFKFILALNSSPSVLIEGLPASGKSSLVENFCKLIGIKLTRVNLSANTEFIDLVGKEIPVTENNKIVFKWINGCLLEALQKGHWLLLDELNLAQQNVLEGLNSVLDHRKSIYISELNQEFKCHKDFKLIATQNPHAVKGRKGLPQSFINRFIHIHFEELTNNDIQEIVRTTFGIEDDLNLNKIVNSKNNRSYNYTIRDFHKYFKYNEDEDIIKEKQHVVLNRKDKIEYLLNKRNDVQNLYNEYKNLPLHYDLIYNLVKLKKFTKLTEPLFIKTNSTILCKKLLTFLFSNSNIKDFKYEVIEGNNELDVYDLVGKYDTNEDINIRSRDDNKAPEFVFKEGIVLKALKEGNIVIFNNVEYIENDVLDKFNALLENTDQERTFEHLNEHYNVHREFKVIFLTENKSPEVVMSSALRSRCNEVNIYFEKRYIEKYVDFYLKQRYVKFTHLKEFYSHNNNELYFKDMLNFVLKSSLKQQMLDTNVQMNEIQAFYNYNDNLHITDQESNTIIDSYMKNNEIKDIKVTSNIKETVIKNIIYIEIKNLLNKTPLDKEVYNRYYKEYISPLFIKVTHLELYNNNLYRLNDFILQNNILNLIQKSAHINTIKTKEINNDNIIDALNTLEVTIKQQFESIVTSNLIKFDVYINVINVLYNIEQYNGTIENNTKFIQLQKSFYQTINEIMKSFTRYLSKENRLYDATQIQFNDTLGYGFNIDYQINTYYNLAKIIKAAVDIMQNDNLKTKYNNMISNFDEIINTLKIELTIRKSIQYNQYPNCIVYSKVIKSNINKIILHHTKKRDNLVVVLNLINNKKALEILLTLKEKVDRLVYIKKKYSKHHKSISTMINMRIQDLNDNKNEEDYEFYKTKYGLTKKRVVLHTRQIQNDSINKQYINFLFNTENNKNKNKKIYEIEEIQNNNIKSCCNFIMSKYITTTICGKLLYIKTPLVSYISHKTKSKNCREVYTLNELLDKLVLLKKITKREIKMLNRILKALTNSIFESFYNLQYFNKNFYYSNTSKLNELNAFNFINDKKNASNSVFFEYLENNKQKEFDLFKKEVINLVNANSIKYKDILDMKDNEEILGKVKTVFKLIGNSIRSKYNIFIAKLNTYNFNTFNEKLENRMEVFNNTFKDCNINKIKELTDNLKGKNLEFIINQIDSNIINTEFPKISKNELTTIKSISDENIESIMNFSNNNNLKQLYSTYTKIKILQQNFKKFKELITEQLEHKSLQNYKTKIVNSLNLIYRKFNTNYRFTDFINIGNNTDTFIKLKDETKMDDVVFEFAHFYFNYNEILTNLVLFYSNEEDRLESIKNELIIKNELKFNILYKFFKEFKHNGNIVLIFMKYAVDDICNNLQLIDLNGKDFIIKQLYQSAMKSYRFIHRSCIFTKNESYNRGLNEAYELNSVKEQYLFMNEIVIFLNDEIKKIIEDYNKHEKDDIKENNEKNQNEDNEGELDEGVGLGEGKGEQFNEQEQIASDQYNDDLNNNGKEEGNEEEDKQHEDVEGIEQDNIEGEIDDVQNSSNDLSEDDFNGDNDEIQEIEDDVVNMENLDIEEKYDELISNSDDEFSSAENNGSEDTNDSFEISLTESGSGYNSGSGESLNERSDGNKPGEDSDDEEEDVYYNIEDKSKHENDIEPEKYQVPSFENENNNKVNMDAKMEVNDIKEDLDSNKEHYDNDNCVKEEDSDFNGHNEVLNEDSVNKEKENKIEVLMKDVKNDVFELDKDIRNYHSIKDRIQPLIQSAYNLFEIALETIHKRKYKGFFKAGKKISLKRIIDYFSSNYTRRNFWLKKVQIPKCNFNINLVIDDSYSLVVNKSHFKALESFVLLNECFKSLQRSKECENNSFNFECYRFGEVFERLKDIEELSFNQKTTNWNFAINEMLKSELESDCKQINIFVTDGRINQNKNDIKWALENNIEVVNGDRAFFVVIMDGKENTIKEVKSVSVIDGNVEVKYYLEDFPFEKYVIVEDCEELPMKLAQIIMGWLESN